MILKFNKTLNTENQYTLIQIDSTDSIIDIAKFSGNNSIYEALDNYYFYTNKIINIENYEKFKIMAKKGDIVSLTAMDNSFLVYPSKKTFSIAFNLDYNKVLRYEYKEVVFNSKPYQVKYPAEKTDKINDGVVYTLSQLCTYISSLIMGYNYRDIKERINGNTYDDDKIKRVLTKYYNSKTNFKFDKKYELNVKTIYPDKNNIYRKEVTENVSKSNMYMYDYYLLRMFAYMILVKSLKDFKTNTEAKYRFDRTFEKIEEVYDFLEENQEIVNKFFVEIDILFNNPNHMCSGYCPKINGVYMFYECNNVKKYLYRAIDKQHFDDKTLKPTYVTTKYNHRIKGIKNIYTME